MLDDEGVLVVGGGLSGLATAMFLAHYGTRVTVVERQAVPWSTTRYQRLSVRTMEVLRGLGLEADVRSTGSHPSELGDMIRVDTVAGTEIARQVQPSEAVSAEISSVQPHRCRDSVLRALVRDRAVALGAELRRGVELLDLDPDGDRDGVTVRVRGADGETVIRAPFVVGADGADSTVRRRAGIPTVGPGTVGRQFSVFFRANLDAAVRGRHFAAFQIDRVGGSLLSESEEEPERDAWCLVLPLPPGDQPPREERLPELLRAAVGVDQLGVEIYDVQLSTSTIVSSERFREDRVLLVGDAAYVIPMGPGLSGNSILQDAQNLAWKLSAVLSGTAGARLLDTYDTERRPLAELLVRGALARVKALRPPDAVADRLTFELGVRYASPAVVSGPDGIPDDGPGFVDPASSGGQPGVRAPHLEIDLNGTRRSLVDLYGHGFVLVTGAEGREWTAAASGASTWMSVPLSVYQLGVDFRELGRGWARTHGVTDTGAVLVRPDGIVGWRCPEMPAAPGAEIERVLRALLAWPALSLDGDIR